MDEKDGNLVNQIDLLKQNNIFNTLFKNIEDLEYDLCIPGLFQKDLEHKNCNPNNNRIFRSQRQFATSNQNPDKPVGRSKTRPKSHSSEFNRSRRQQ